MLKNDWGQVIFLSSESGLNIPADMLHYGVTKTADLALSRGLAKRAAGTGVTVNAVLPGPTLSEGVQAMPKDAAAAAGQSIEQAARGVREGAAAVLDHRARRQVKEVANLVVYVASPQGSATIGAALRVDGGVVDTIA